MKIKLIVVSIIGILLLILSAIIGGVYLSPHNSHELIVATVSLAVALLALAVGVFTYFSIDEVNAISRMDGNVMENPRYHPNLLKYFLHFRQMKLEDSGNELIKYMEELFSHKIKSGARLSDNVQEIADMLVLVPFLIRSNDTTTSTNQKKRMVTLIKKMKSRVSEFESISDGSCKLLNETVDLIDSVFTYQTFEHANGKNSSKLMEIRGSLFINPATCVLYYDYLGLYFLRRASDIISNYQDIKSVKEKIEMVRSCNRDDLSLAKMYALKASEVFRHAKENAGDDMMWSACTCFNIARAEYMIQQINVVLEEDVDNKWEKYANESIRGWITLNKIIAEHLGAENQVSWLQQALISQENKMHLTKIIYQMMNHQSLTDYNGKEWIKPKDYAHVEESSLFRNLPQNDPQARTDSLVREIKNMV